MEQKEFTITIKYKAPRAFNIGDVFYIVEKGKTKSIGNSCPCCLGEKQITYNEFTFECPICKNKLENRLINHYVVRAYKVCSIAERTSKDVWNLEGKTVAHYIVVKLFRKKDRKRGAKHFNIEELFFEFNARYGLKNLNSEIRPEAYVGLLNYRSEPPAIFDNYDMAKELADAVNEHIKNKILKENELAHRNYLYPDFSDDLDDKKEK